MSNSATYFNRGAFPVAQHSKAEVLGVWVSGTFEYRVYTLPIDYLTHVPFNTQNYGDALREFERRIA